jgi:hypothetical protein
MNQLKFSQIVANQNVKLFPLQVELDENTVKGFDNDIYPKILPIAGIGTAVFRQDTTLVEHREASEEAEAGMTVQGGELIGREIPVEVELLIPAKPSGMGFFARAISKARGELAQPVYKTTANLISHPED